jgi:hypothetical protein
LIRIQSDCQPHRLRCAWKPRGGCHARPTARGRFVISDGRCARRRVPRHRCGTRRRARLHETRDRRQSLVRGPSHRHRKIQTRYPGKRNPALRSNKKVARSHSPQCSNTDRALHLPQNQWFRSGGRGAHSGQWAGDGAAIMSMFVSDPAQTNPSPSADLPIEFSLPPAEAVIGRNSVASRVRRKQLATNPL